MSAPAVKAASAVSGPVASPSLVGREREREALLTAVQRTPALITIEGEAGVGKTRLVQELVEFGRSKDLTVLVGNCHHLREPFPLGPVIQALRQARFPDDIELSAVTGAVAPHLPELSDRLPQPPNALTDPAAERHRVLRGLISLLDAFSPAILVLEDLHWVDEYTHEFLALLLADMPRQVGVVVTYRREDLSERNPLVEVLSRPPPGVLRTGLSLGPLDASGVKALVGSILATDEVSEPFATYLFDRTAGLPFAIEEVLKLLQERRDLLRQDGRWIRRALDSIEVPGAVRDSVLERFYRLSADARKMTDAAAILGEPADEDTLKEIAGLSEAKARAGLSETLATTVLQETPSGLYTFRHVLAMQSVYEAIPRPRRRELHGCAGRVLERAGDPLPLARLIFHFREAQEPQRSAAYAEKAADIAVSLHDEKGACRFLQEALTALGLDAETKGRMATKLGYAALHGLAHSEAIGVLQEIIATTDVAPSVRGELRYFLSGLLSQSGKLSAAREQDLLSIPELEERPALLARALTGMAYVEAPENTVEDHLAWLDQALATAARVDDLITKVAVAVDQASVLADIGDSRAWELIDVLDPGGLSPEELKQVARGYANFAQAAFFLGHYDRARRFIDRGCEIGAQLGYERFDVDLEIDKALLAWATGRWDGLQDLAARLAEGAEDCPQLYFKARMMTASLLLTSGDAERAEPILRDIIERGRTHGGRQAAVWAAGRLALIELARQNATQACEIVMAGIEDVRSKRNWVWASELVAPATQALIDGGREEDATLLVKELGAELEKRDSRVGHAALIFARALLTSAADQQEDAAELFAASARAWQALPRPYEALVALEERGKLGKNDDLFAALEGFESLGASWDAARVRRAIRERGIALPYPWRGGRRGYGVELSPREKEVAELAARGQTNIEIAEALFLSPKTVGHHLGSAMRKLGVHSRRELA